MKSDGKRLLLSVDIIDSTQGSPWIMSCKDVTLHPVPYMRYSWRIVNSRAPIGW